MIETITKENAIIGYKGLKKIGEELKCRDLVYVPGQIYVHNSDPKTCNSGFHFCEKLEDVFPHYNANKDNVFYKVRAWGKIDKQNDKSSCQFIELLTQVDKQELLEALLAPHLLEVDKIIKANSNAIICGSLALIIRGFIEYRNIGDIDITMPYFSEFIEDENLKLISKQKNIQKDNQFGQSGNETIQMTVNNVKFDLFLEPNETWSWVTIKGKDYKVSSVKKIIEAKMRYFLNGNLKHCKDLIEIMEKISSGDIYCENPKFIFQDNSISLFNKENRKKENGNERTYYLEDLDF